MSDIVQCRKEDGCCTVAVRKPGSNSLLRRIAAVHAYTQIVHIKCVRELESMECGNFLRLQCRLRLRCRSIACDTVKSDSEEALLVVPETPVSIRPAATQWFKLLVALRIFLR